MSSGATPPVIPRDRRYWQTLWRDSARQTVRRLVHQFKQWQEKQQQVPVWQAFPADQKRLHLSTCIITMNSADRIRPLLAYIRSFSNEVVIGVDSKTTDQTLEVCEQAKADGLIDTLFVIESTALTCNAGLEQLVTACTGDWVLRLDDDEFPEPLFKSIVNGLIHQDAVTHYKLPRLHLCTIDPLSWINDGYLYPDFQMRLFKNDPALLHFPGAVGHSSIRCDGPQGKVHSVNLVHLNLAINPRFKREEKLSSYIKRLNGGWVHPINERALLWEDFPYNIEPYTYPDPAFCQAMTETVKQQRSAYEATLPVG